MIKMVKIMIFSISSILLVGCGRNTGWFRDRSNDYVKAECYPTLKISADTHPQTFSQEYQVPES